jgi:DNA-directed RNA polymerase specialized sigma24 family protein
MEDSPRELRQEDYHFGTRADFFTPDKVTDLKDRKAKVRAAIDSLPEHFRVMLVMRDLEGFSYEEIASMLELPLGTVKSRINRARLEFKKQVEPLLSASRSNDPSIFWKAGRREPPVDPPSRTRPNEEGKKP